MKKLLLTLLCVSSLIQAVPQTQLSLALRNQAVEVCEGIPDSEIIIDITWDVAEGNQNLFFYLLQETLREDPRFIERAAAADIEEQEPAARALVPFVAAPAGELEQEPAAGAQ